MPNSVVGGGAETLEDTILTGISLGIVGYLLVLKIVIFNFEL